MTKTTFGKLKVGKWFVANRRVYKKITPVISPKRGCVIANALAVETDKKAVFGDAAKIQVVEETAK